MSPCPEETGGKGIQMWSNAVDVIAAHKVLFCHHTYYLDVADASQPSDNGVLKPIHLLPHILSPLLSLILSVALSPNLWVCTENPTKASTE